MSDCHSSDSWETNSGTDICEQEVYWGLLSRTISWMVERSKIKQREKLNCDIVITKASAMKLGWPFRFVLN